MVIKVIYNDDSMTFYDNVDTHAGYEHVLKAIMDGGNRVIYIPYNNVKEISIEKENQ